MLRIATFNIENLDLDPTDKNPILTIRKPVLQTILNRMNADILCLQEVHGQETEAHTSSNPDRNLSALDTVIAGTKYENYQRAYTVTSDNVPYNQRNLVVLSRFAINQADVKQYKNDHIEKLQYKKVTSLPVDDDAKDLSWERPILHVKVTDPSFGELNVINLHLKSRLASNIPGQKLGFSWKTAAGWAEGYFLSSLKRVGQALETRVLIDKIIEESPNAKIVVCGDFNSEPGEVPVEAICGRVENTENPKLRSHVLVPCSNGIPESVRYSHLHIGRGNLLDHMLISQALLPAFRGAYILNENLHDESLPFTSDTKYPESDHAPFVSEFEF